MLFSSLLDLRLHPRHLSRKYKCGWDQITTAIVKYNHPSGQRRRPLRGLIFETICMAWFGLVCSRMIRFTNTVAASYLEANKNLLFITTRIAWDPASRLLEHPAFLRGWRFRFSSPFLLPETPDIQASISRWCNTGIKVTSAKQDYQAHALTTEWQCNSDHSDESASIFSNSSIKDYFSPMHLNWLSLRALEVLYS